MKRIIETECDEVELKFVIPWTTDLVRCVACQLELFDAFRIRQCSKAWRDTIDFMMHKSPSWAANTLYQWLRFLGSVPHLVRNRDGENIRLLNTIPHYVAFSCANVNWLADDYVNSHCWLCNKLMALTHKSESECPYSFKLIVCPDIRCALGMELARIRNLCTCLNFENNDFENNNWTCYQNSDDESDSNEEDYSDNDDNYSVLYNDKGRTLRENETINHIASFVPTRPCKCLRVGYPPHYGECRPTCPKFVDAMPCFDFK